MLYHRQSSIELRIFTLNPPSYPSMYLLIRYLHRTLKFYQVTLIF